MGCAVCAAPEVSPNRALCSDRVAGPLSLTGTGRSSAEVLGVADGLLAETLAGHLRLAA
jgi:hypothetical protein